MDEKLAKIDNVRRFHLLRAAIKCGCVTCRSSKRNIQVAYALVRKGLAEDTPAGKESANHALANIETYYATLEKNLALHATKPIVSTEQVLSIHEA